MLIPNKDGKIDIEIRSIQQIVAQKNTLSSIKDRNQRENKFAGHSNLSKDPRGNAFKQFHKPSRILNLSSGVHALIPLGKFLGNEHVEACVLVSGA